MDIWLNFQISATIIIVIMVALDSVLNDGNYYPTIGGFFALVVMIGWPLYFIVQLYMVII